MAETNPDENLDAEGMPETEEAPPGIDIETNSEGVMAPRDYSVAAGSDPAYPVTADEQRTKESVAARAARENPDFGYAGRARPAGDAAPRLFEPDSDIEEVDLTSEEVALGEEDEGGAPSAEEQAMHIQRNA
jgi:hypothetical protein